MKQEYKRESFVMFQRMLENIKYEVIKILSLVQVQDAEEVEAMEEERKKEIESQQMEFKHDSVLGEDEEESSASETKTIRHNGKRVRRNDPCPCGSGKKYKRCCGQLG